MAALSKTANQSSGTGWHASENWPHKIFNKKKALR